MAVKTEKDKRLFSSDISITFLEKLYRFHMDFIARDRRTSLTAYSCQLSSQRWRVKLVQWTIHCKKNNKGLTLSLKNCEKNIEQAIKSLNTANDAPKSISKSLHKQSTCVLTTQVTVCRQTRNNKTFGKTYNSFSRADCTTQALFATPQSCLLHTINKVGAFFVTVLSTSIWYSSLQQYHIYNHFILLLLLLLHLILLLSLHSFFLFIVLFSDVTPG